MSTHLSRGTVKPRDRMNLSVVHNMASPLPCNYRSVLANQNWRAAMATEFQALMDNGTWDLVPHPPGANIVTGKWIFKHKHNSDGSLARHKARWVVCGYSQRPGLDYDETFSPVIKPTTICVILNLAVTRGWPIHQLDMKNAFLHGNLNETVYCQQPPGFIDPTMPKHVFLLHKYFYSLKQAPRAWYQRFAAFITTIGFTSSSSDTSLFVYKDDTQAAYLLLYVDDIILTALTPSLLEQLMDCLHSEFSMTDLGDLSFFLDISVQHDSDGLHLSQRQYAIDLLQHTGMVECHSTSAPIDTQAKLSATAGSAVANPSEYRSIAGALQYMTLTHPDLAYAVQQACLHMHDPRKPHLALLKRILHHIKGTLDHGFHIDIDTSQMLTGSAAPTHAVPPPATVSTLAITSSHGRPSNRPRSPAPVPRPSIAQLHTSLPSAVGYVNS